MGFMTMLRAPQLTVIQPWIKIAIEYLRSKNLITCADSRANYQIAVRNWEASAECCR